MNEGKERLSDEEWEQLAMLLSRMTWPVTPAVFDALCGAVTTTGIELVVFRHNPDDRRLEVLLHRRPDHDRFYAGQWHTSGTLLQGHETDESAFARLVQDELNEAITRVDRPVQFVTANHFFPARGAEVTRLFAVIIEAYEGPGDWFPVSRLPNNLIEHHKTLLQQALGWYEGQDS